MSTVSTVIVPTSQGAPGSTAGAIDYARSLLGWALVIIVLAALSRTRTGYVVIYYALWLAIIFLVLGSYQRVTDLLAYVRAPAGPSSGG